MKNILKLLFTFLIAGAFFSCEKKVESITYGGGTAPALTANRTGTIPLSFASKDNEAVTLSWTNPNYQFSTGLSSHDVSYKLEFDVEGSNFSHPKQITFSRDLTTSFTQGDMNDYLLNVLNLTPGVAKNIEFRVTSNLINNSVPLMSNILKFSMTPYAIPPKVAPPASGELYIVGSATIGGWNNPVPVPDQKFTQVSPTFYTITVTISGGNSYLMLPVNGDWGAKYGGVGANNTNNPSEDDFKPQGGDLLAPTASGSYKIDVDFQKGRYKLTKL